MTVHANFAKKDVYVFGDNECLSRGGGCIWICPILLKFLESLKTFQKYPINPTMELEVIIKPIKVKFTWLYMLNLSFAQLLGWLFYFQELTVESIWYNWMKTQKVLIFNHQNSWKRGLVKSLEITNGFLELRLSIEFNKNKIPFIEQEL